MTYEIFFDLKASGALPWSEIRVGRPLVKGNFIPKELASATFWFPVQALNPTKDICFLAQSKLWADETNFGSKIWRFSEKDRSLLLSRVIAGRVGEIEVVNDSEVIAHVYDPAVDRRMEEHRITDWFPYFEWNEKEVILGAHRWQAEAEIEKAIFAPPYIAVLTKEPRRNLKILDSHLRMSFEIEAPALFGPEKYLKNLRFNGKQFVIENALGGAYVVEPQTGNLIFEPLP